MKMHRNNYYPGCPAPGCEGSMYSEENGTAKCLVCGCRAGDASQILNASSGNLDFIHAGPIKGWKPASEVAAGLAKQKPDAASDPFAKSLRRAIEFRKAATEEGRSRTLDQLTAVSERQEAARDAKEEQRAFVSRRQATAAQKVARLARAQFQPE